MQAAFTGYGFVTAGQSEQGDTVIITEHNEGLHTADLNLSASGNKLVWPEASAKTTIAGDKFMRLEPYAGPAGLEAFLPVFT